MMSGYRMGIIAWSQLIMTLTYASCTSPAHSYRSELRARWSAWARLNHGAAAAAAAAAADYDVSFEVRCRRSRWIAVLVTSACGRSNHWLSELVQNIFSDTFTLNTEMRGNYFENRKFCGVGGPTPELGLVRWCRSRRQMPCDLLERLSEPGSMHRHPG